MIAGPGYPTPGETPQWGTSVGIPLLGVLVLFAAAPLGVWAAALSALVAGAAAVAMFRQDRIHRIQRRLAAELAARADRIAGDTTPRHRRIAELADLIAARTGVDDARRTELATAVTLRSLDRLVEPNDPVCAPALVAGCVSSWAQLAGILAGRGDDEWGRQAVLIIDIADRYDALRSQALGPVAAINLLAAASPPEERRLLEALTDVVVLSPSF